MKIFVATIIILLSFYIIKVDLFEGTIPLAFFSEEECIENIDFIPVEIVTGDTFYSLFAMYPASQSITYQERLADFYELNPHLVNQTIKTGEQVLLPIYSFTKACENES